MNLQNKETNTLEAQTREQFIKYTFETGTELITTQEGVPLLGRNLGEMNYSIIPVLSRLRYVVGSVSEKNSKNISATPQPGDFLVTENQFGLWKFISRQRIAEINTEFYLQTDNQSNYKL